MIDIIKVTDKKSLKAFVMLPWTIYKGNEYWVPPLIKDEYYLFDRNKNIFFDESDAEFFLAKKNGVFVGRIAAIKYQRHLDACNDNTAFFGFFESIDDQDVANALFNAAADWSKKQKLTRVIGPYNFTFDDGGGLLLDHFDDIPAYKMNYNLNYYPELISNFGFDKMLDLYTYECDLANSDISRFQKVTDRAFKRNHITIDTVDPKNLKEDLDDCYEIYQDAFQDSIGTVDLDKDKFFDMAIQIVKYADPDFVYIARHKGEAVGIGLVIPDLNPVIKKWNGRFFPRGFFSLLMREHKRLKRLRFTLIAAKKEYRRLGIDAALFQRSIKVAKRKGYVLGEASWIQESNFLVQKPLEKLGFHKAKTYRIYEKAV